MSSGQQSEEQKALQKFLKRRHPDYDKLLPHWEFLEATYNGGREWFANNIFRYLKEGDKEYADRLERALRFNHTREVVDLVQKYIFKAVIARNEVDAPEILKDFWTRATLGGLDIEQFMRLVSVESSKLGMPWIVVDSNMTESILSVAEAKEIDARCYAYLVKPQDVLDVGFDEREEPLWILLRETRRDDQDPIFSTGAIKVQYRLWTREDWSLYEIQKNGRREEVVLVDYGIHALGEVPAFPHTNTMSGDTYSAPALINDIAYQDRAVANYLSNLDAIIQDQTFSQLAIPNQGLTPGEDAYDKMLEMGTKRIFTYDSGEGGNQPHYLSPDVKQAELILAAINKIINEIYSTVGLAGERTKEDNAVGIDNSSGVAKAYDFERLNTLLVSKSESLENSENKLARLVCLWHSEKAPERDLVGYADTFDVRSLFDEFTVAERLATVSAPDIIRREQMKQVTAKLFPKAGEKLEGEIAAELEQWPKDPVEEAAKLAAATAPTNFGGDAEGKTPKSKNPQTQSRQGQVTSETKK